MKHDQDDAAGPADHGESPPLQRPAPLPDHERAPQRPFDELPAQPWRGPITFGIVAATLQVGGLLWLAKCR